MSSMFEARLKDLEEENNKFKHRIEELEEENNKLKHRIEELEGVKVKTKTKSSKSNTIDDKIKETQEHIQMNIQEKRPISLAAFSNSFIYYVSIRFNISKIKINIIAKF